jgi:hypothetical protein
MGRNKKYLSEEQKKEAQRKWSQNYYVKNKKQIDEKARARYHQDLRDL